MPALASIAIPSLTPVFVIGILGLPSIPHLTNADHWPKAGIALAALLPIFLILNRFDCGGNGI